MHGKLKSRREIKSYRERHSRRQRQGKRKESRQKRGVKNGEVTRAGSNAGRTVTGRRKVNAPKRPATLRMSDSAEQAVLHNVRNGDGGTRIIDSGEEKCEASWGRW